ncbi:hypothetical protein IC575_027561 [Cucumis melo]|uniref:Pectinesterase inhibitor domain-containing protein n=3 Tax=Cucumis melo TaxID=3656 RepID=A0A1S3CBM6_CUCME
MSSLSHSILIPCLFLFMLIFSNFPITQSSNNNNNTSSLIYKTCKASSEQDPNISFDFCITSLKPAATKHRHGDTSLRRLGLMTIYLIRHNMSSTRHHIKKLQRKKGPGDPFVKLCLTDCLELYSDAIPMVKQARKDYKAGRYADANSKISSVMDDCSTCEEGFEEKEGVVSPLTNRNHNAFELSAIALSIINML